MTIKDFLLKIKKRLHYKMAGVKSIETYFMRVIDSNKDTTTFDYYGYHFVARLKNSSDYGIANQILVKEEYRVSKSFFDDQNIIPQNIIDAGANIGLTTIYLKRFFPQATVYCIEPDSENYDILSRNLSKFTQDNSVKLYKSGLLAKGGLNLKIGTDFRDHSNCARQVVITNEQSELQSITVNDILSQNNFNIIDFLKIDIEGAETFLIEDGADVSFLNSTRCIAIEIHDEYNCREEIYTLLKKHGFVLVSDKETTIAINKNL